METQRPNLLPLLFICFSLRLISAVGESNYSNTTNGTDFIRTSCGATLYPDVCFSSLSRYAAAVGRDPAQLARAAITVSLAKTKHMAAYVSNVSRQADYGAASDPRAAAALHDCFSNFGDAVDEIRGSLRQMRHLDPGVAGAGGESFRFQMSNVQTWMSAALTDQETCTDGFEDVSDGPVKADVIGRANEVKKHTSNALALVNHYAEKAVP
ncbi:Pectinesterase inhibitor domain containing protein [Trema orientale]|uniref:Pectinesterase inhibitor domain containing protein n=1 Tax=Trema orientale TaxID=63057 RepID=A0A2P5EP55_TREOI|nr:Pectinesterase inhibitor domain containing protein [Trema orientale]